MGQPERVLEMAHAFLQEVRRDMEKAAGEGNDLPPRLRTVQARPGHGSPEFRTLAIPLPAAAGGNSPEMLSTLIARYAAEKPATCLLLALDVISSDDDGTQRPLLIAEARDRFGTRFYLMQPFSVKNGVLRWEEPQGGGWQDPGGEEMILDAAFEGKSR